MPRRTGGKWDGQACGDLSRIRRPTAVVGRSGGASLRPPSYVIGPRRAPRPHR